MDMKTLTEKDANLFYRLWLPLLDYVNDTYQICPLLKNMASAKHLDPSNVMKVAEYLWSHTEIIDDYLDSKANLPEEHREIVYSWKRHITSDFLMERHLKDGTIFIETQYGNIYQVCGIISEWEEMFYGVPLPLMVHATFIPFRDVIISDGLVIPMQIRFGSNIKKTFRDAYLEAKRSRLIIRSL